MSCCDETTARVPSTDVSRRSVLKGASVIASVIPAARQPTPRRKAAASSSPIAASSCAACPTRSRARPAISRSTGSTSSWSIPAAAARPCRRWSAAPSTTPRPRSTSPSPPSPSRRRHPPLRRHRPAAAVRARHRAEDRQHDHELKELEGRTVGVSGARQCRPCADALSAQAGRRRRQQGQVRDHGRQSPGSVAAGPGRRRPGAGAGADAVAARRRARAGERHGSRGRARTISAAPTSSWASRCAPRRSSSAGPRWSRWPRRSPTRSRRCSTMSGDGDRRGASRRR